MKKLFHSFLLCTTFTGVTLKTADQWLEFSEQQIQGKRSVGEYAMTIKTENWERNLEIESSIEGTDRSLIFIKSPAKEKGIGTLRIGNNLWNYFPKIKKKIIVSPSMLLSSWMGSDFTNDDLLKASSVFVDYHHDFLPDETINNEVYKVINNTAKSEAKVIWPQIISYSSFKDCLPRIQKYYDKKGNLKRTMTFSEVKKFGNHLVPSVIEIRPEDNSQKVTRLIYKKLNFDVTFKSDQFSEKKLTGN